MKGVGFLVYKRNVKSILECAPISSRIISIRLAAKPQNMSIVQVHAPTKLSDEQTLEQFYRELEENVKLVPRKDILIVQGDWNAKRGRYLYDVWKETIGKFGLGHANDRGQRLLELTKQHKLVIANTLLKHKLTRTATWHSPGGLHHNQIDFILVSKRCQSGINGAKTQVFPGADVGSDHDLLMMTMKVKVASRQRQDYARLRYDIEKLKDTTILEEFHNTLGEKFALLLLLDNI